MNMRALVRPCVYVGVSVCTYMWMCVRVCMHVCGVSVCVRVIECKCGECVHVCLCMFTCVRVDACECVCV